MEISLTKLNDEYLSKDGKLQYKLVKGTYSQQEDAFTNATVNQKN